MPFLRPTEKEMLAFAAQNYDGKKNVWVPHKKEGFVKAEVQDRSGEKVTVKTSKGEVNSVHNFLCVQTSLKTFFPNWSLRALCQLDLVA